MAEMPAGGLTSVTIYTDGGADPNPGPGGWGALLIHPASGTPRELRGGEPRTTNNRMELTAAIRALGALREPCRVELHTDSQYLRRGVTEWLPGWIARGWRRKDGELQNEDLWRELAAAIERHQIRWHWVKGHAGDRHNARADQLATIAIREQRAAAAAAAGPGSARGAAGEAAGAPPEYEVYLRVSMNPRGGGWAALIRRGGAGAAEATAATGAEGAGGETALSEETVRSGGLPAGTAATSNALDLVAAAAVLEALPAGAAVAVHTGSDYLRLGASRWLEGWRQRGWKTKEGGPVLNRTLWERLATALAARRVTWPEVKGREVEELDRLGPVAKAAAQGRTVES
ncbi:MAG TPA: ribonuclease HI [Thermoanaerobaculia bacterium]|nr:ribonuclease HI [Thermoanaerobaculia bacterium]